MNKPLVKLLSWLVALLTPLFLIGLALRLMLGTWFLHLEYRCFQVEQRGMRPKQDSLHRHGVEQAGNAADSFLGRDLETHVPGSRHALELGAAKGRCAAVIANSRSVADDIRERMRMPAPIVVMHNAIDLDRFSPKGARIDLDRLAGLPAAELMQALREHLQEFAGSHAPEDDMTIMVCRATD